MAASPFNLQPQLHWSDLLEQGIKLIALWFRLMAIFASCPSVVYGLKSRHVSQPKFNGDCCFSSRLWEPTPSKHDLDIALL